MRSRSHLSLIFYPSSTLPPSFLNKPSMFLHPIFVFVNRYSLKNSSKGYDRRNDYSTEFWGNWLSAWIWRYRRHESERVLIRKNLVGVVYRFSLPYSAFYGYLKKIIFLLFNWFIIHSFTHLFVYLFIYLFVYLFIYLFIHLFVCLII